MKELFYEIGEIFYDILGYILQGSVFILFFMVTTNDNLPNIIMIQNINVVYIIMLSYLIGHIIRFVSNQIYSSWNENLIFFSLYTASAKNSKISKLYENYMNKEKLFAVKTDLPLESMIRYKIRQCSEKVLVQKYIAKQNMYRSLAVTAILFWVYNTIDLLVGNISNAIIIIGACIIVNFLIVFFKDSGKKSNQAGKEKQKYNHVLITITIILLVSISIYHSGTPSYLSLAMNVLYLLFYYSFEYEYRRHSILLEKETMIFAELNIKNNH